MDSFWHRTYHGQMYNRFPVDYLEPARRIYPEDLDPWAKRITEPIRVLVLIVWVGRFSISWMSRRYVKKRLKRNRWDFLVTASPVAVPGATGSPLNPIATF